MAFRIGAVKADTEVVDGSYRIMGNGTRTMGLDIRPRTLEEASAISHQFRGQVGKLVAVTWTDDPEMDGLYIVEDCTVTPISNYIVNNVMGANVSLKQQSDLVEAAYDLTFDNAVSLTPGKYLVSAIHGRYAGSDAQSHASDNGGNGSLLYLFDQRGIADENDIAALLDYGDAATPTVGRTVQVQQGCNPALYDIGRARIEVRAAGSAFWWTLTGMSVPEGHDLRITNGLVRTTVVHGAPYVLQELWDATDERWWNSARYQFHITAVVGGFIRRWRILRNDHAQVVVRCPLVRYDSREATVDLSVTRGVGMTLASLSFGFEGEPAAGFTCTMQEYDGTNMATTAVSTDGIKRSAVITGATYAQPYLHGHDAHSTPSTTTDTVAYLTSTNRFGLGMSDGVDGDAYTANLFRTLYLLGDTVVP